MPYVYPRLTQARNIARAQGLPKPYSSQRAGKKLYIVYNGKEIHFGARGYSDFLEHQDESRRQNYRARHRGVLLSNGRPAYKDPNQPAFYAYRILW
jgi:hypothetical protein